MRINNFNIKNMKNRIFSFIICTGLISGIQAQQIVINPDYGYYGETVQVSITGTNTHFQQGSGTIVYISNSQSSPTTINGYNTQIINDILLTTKFNIPSYISSSVQ